MSNSPPLAHLACAVVLCAVAMPTVAAPNLFADAARAERFGDYPQAISGYLTLAERGVDQAMLALARCYDHTGQADQANGWYERAAAAGNRFAQYELGRAYASGERGLAPDAARATRLLSAAAQDGHADAALLLFRLSGDVRWLQSAAELGVSEAMALLAEAYDTGRYGVAPDAQARDYWREELALANEEGSQP